MKIPKAHKHGNYWRIRITVNGVRKTVTATTKAECVRLTKEFYLTQIVQQKQFNNLAENTLTLYDLMLLYMEDILKKRRTHASEYVAFRKMAKEYPWLFEKKLQDIEVTDIAKWKSVRSMLVGNSSILRERTRMSVLFTYAQKHLLIPVSNPVQKVIWDTSHTPRNRRISDDEIDRLIKASGYVLGTKPKNQRQLSVWACLFAIHTCMRQTEILGTRRKDIHESHIHLPVTKNGTSRDVPLTPYAKELLSWLEIDKMKPNDKLFKGSITSFRHKWKIVVDQAGIQDLHFHDTRHEAISRFVHKYKMPVETLAKITGHRDLRTLLNTYYNPTVDEILEMMK